MFQQAPESAFSGIRVADRVWETSRLTVQRWQKPSGRTCLVGDVVRAVDLEHWRCFINDHEVLEATCVGKPMLYVQNGLQLGIIFVIGEILTNFLVFAVDWLDHSKTLREQGIDPSETLLLRRKYFFSDQNVDARDPIQLNLLYVQVQMRQVLFYLRCMNAASYWAT